MNAWLLIVLFIDPVVPAKVAVFENEKDCQRMLQVTKEVIGKRKEVKSIECVKGELH